MTPGRYVFLPRGWPHLPFVHHFGSSNWTRGNLEEEGPWDLGEFSRGGWTNGQRTTDLPPAQILGSASCLTDGDRWPLPVLDRQLVGGWDSRCFGLKPLPKPIPPVDLKDVGIRDNQIAYAIALDLLYTDPAAAEASLQAFLGPDAVITTTPNGSSLFPGSMIAVMPTYTVVLVSGTTTPEQLAVQSMYAGGGPTNFGLYATNDLWKAAATVLNIRIGLAGADPAKPIVLVGHSYGGAAATVLAADYSLWLPSRDIRLLTFGAPKPGDIRLTKILQNVTGVNLVNLGDPVPLLPPGYLDIAPLSPFIAAAFLLAWVQWQSAPGQQYLDAVGNLTESPRPYLPFTALLAIALIAASGTPMSAFADHALSEYIVRLIGS